jgi:hypothetical protein
MADTDDRSGSVKAVMYLFLALAWITYPMRVWVRVKMLKAVGLDDILTTITMVSSPRLKLPALTEYCFVIPDPSVKYHEDLE